MNNNQFNRRRFLLSSISVVAAGVCARALEGCAGGGGGGGAGAAGIRDTGLTAADLAVGQCAVPSGADYILARDAGGFYAFSNRCTHQGATLACPDASGVIVCPDHQARFSSDGTNLSGPDGRGTTASLEHYRVVLTGEGSAAQISVDTSVVETDRSARAMPSEARADGGSSDDAAA